MRLRRLLVVVEAVALNLAFVDAALAAPKDRAPSDKKALAYIVATPVEGEQDGGKAVSRAGALTLTAASSGCNERQFRVSGYNILGWRLWSYVRSVYWCWSGSYLTYVSSRAWGEVHIFGWAFKGTIGSWSIGGSRYTYYRVWSQGHFCLVEYFSCIQNVYPWIDVTVYPGGGWRWSRGG
jgi:hypothetical protein